MLKVSEIESFLHMAGGQKVPVTIVEITILNQQREVWAIDSHVESAKKSEIVGERVSEILKDIHAAKEATNTKLKPLP